MASINETVIGFKNVDFHYDFRKPILDEVNFNVRKGAKITIMGQNGAGKSTLFKLINGNLEKTGGLINLDKKATIATSFQVVPAEDKVLSVKDFFIKYIPSDREGGIDKQIVEVLKVVNLQVKDFDKLISAFSGGQQARLLLASALIQDPDILLLDEPTNNLDVDGIWHLTDFLQNYPKTVLVISHDAEFLNSFTEGVLYLDVHTKKVEQFV
jgi:ATPase subunit of ABC transporter with duplicated ATPase domains